MTPWHPGHQGVVNSWCPGSRGVNNLQCPGTPGSRESPVVPDTKDSLFWLFFKLQSNLPSSGKLEIRKSPVSWTMFFYHCFFQTSILCYCFLSSNLSKIIVHLLFSIEILLVHVFKIFITSLFLLQLPVSQTPGSHFKTWITPWKIVKMVLGYL